MSILVSFGIRLLEAIFVLGWAGSVLVLLLSGIEDVHVIFENEEPPKTDPATES